MTGELQTYPPDRKFWCVKCDWTEANVVYSTLDDDLGCECMRCGFKWREPNSQKLKQMQLEAIQKTYAMASA